MSDDLSIGTGLKAAKVGWQVWQKLMSRLIRLSSDEELYADGYMIYIRKFQLVKSKSRALDFGKIRIEIPKRWSSLDGSVKCSEIELNESLNDIAKLQADVKGLIKDRFHELADGSVLEFEFRVPTSPEDVLKIERKESEETTEIEIRNENNFPAYNVQYKIDVRENRPIYDIEFFSGNQLVKHQLFRLETKQILDLTRDKLRALQGIVRREEDRGSIPKPSIEMVVPFDLEPKRGMKIVLYHRAVGEEGGKELPLREIIGSLPSA